MEKPLKVAAVSGILMFVFSLLALFPSILGEIYSPLKIVSMIFYIGSFISSIFFYYGFIILSRRFDAKLLNVMSWIFMIIAIISAIAYIMIAVVSLIALGIQGNLPVNASPLMRSITAYAVEDDITQITAQQTEILGIFAALFIFLLIAFIFIMLIFIVLPTILFGVGMLKLDGKVEHAKIIGILDIVAGATMIILVGFLIALVSFILKIILLWNASQKFESRRRLR